MSFFQEQYEDWLPENIDVIRFQPKMEDGILLIMDKNIKPDLCEDILPR
jgi:hypothetical protein